jgi:hypothetical protein
MFKKNTSHLQPAIISAISDLPQKQLKLLEESWAYDFYHDFFKQIDEEIFAVLYSNEPSRPNVPVNVLVGMEVIKAGYGWSDEELYENYCFNLQVRYALGYDRLGEGDFAIRTLYNFRKRLSEYQIENGENLLETVFQKVTDSLIRKLELRTGMQRMDSTQIASNIVEASRLQLLVEAIQRMYRILSEADQERLADRFAAYLKGTAGQYTYRVKGKEAINAHLQQVGATILNLLTELQDGYGDQSVYQVLERIFSEHFNLVEDRIYPKEYQELTSGSLQSVDDLEASYRQKGHKHYKGYVANLTETCDPENEAQLITKVQVSPNNVDDTQLLAEALPELEEKTELKTLYTDGGYGSLKIDEMLADKDIKHIQTAIRGRKPSTEKLHLSDFEIQQTEAGKPTQIICPHGQKVKVQPSKQRKSFVAHFEKDNCASCPFAAICPAKPGKRDPRRHLRFTQAHVAQRRRRSQIHLQNGENLRAAVEATVRQVKHPFPNSKLPVRGQFRVTCMVIGSAMMSNIRRIQRYRMMKMAQESEKSSNQRGNDAQVSSFLSSFLKSLQYSFDSLFFEYRVFGC